MENELRDFFLTVANHPLPENADKYLEAMRNIPNTASHYEYVKWLRYGFERRRGREKIEGFFYPIADLKVYSLFTDEDFKAFECNRALLTSVLNQTLSSADFFEMRDLLKIIGYANSLQSREVFGVFATPGKCVLGKTMYPPKMDDAADELEEVFAYACYGLVSFLADSKHGGRNRIKKCPICKKFFPARDKKRQVRCYDDSCNKEYERLKKQRQREKEPEIYV
jgi:hypothetical protein